MPTEVKKPTANTEYDNWTTPAYCYDFPATAGDESTMGYYEIIADTAPSIQFHTWAAKGQTYTATVLYLKWKTSIQTGDDEWGIEYTKDGGTGWNDLLAMGVNRSVGYSTAQIALDANQDLTQVEVRVNCDKVKGGDGLDIQISDIWTEGEYSGGAIINIDVTAAVGANAAKQLSQVLNVSKTAGVQGGASDAQVSTLNINKEDIVNVDAIDEVLQILNIDKTAAVNAGTSFTISKVQIITVGAGAEVDASLDITLVFVIDENADVNVAATTQLGMILNINKTAAVNVGAVDDVKRYVHIDKTAVVEADAAKDTIWDLIIPKNADVSCGTSVIVVKVGGTPAGASPGPAGSSSGIGM